MSKTIPGGGHVIFLSTLSLRRATIKTYRKKQGLTLFYPRSPCGERHRCRCRPVSRDSFLSTLSLRRATLRNTRAFTIITFLSTLSLRRATQERFLVQSALQFSIHALLAESDYIQACGAIQAIPFLSTLSLRRATPSTPGKPTIKGFSIHALLAESDRPTLYPLHRQQLFYPRSPCGERLCHRSCHRGSVTFLSTLSLRRATSPLMKCF